MATGGGFSWPVFYYYPPYFTLQPVKETRDKQSALWGSLILAYCKHHKLFILNPGEDNVLFHNQEIQRRLPADAARSFIEDLAAQGSARWLDPQKTRCLVLWRKIEEWAQLIHEWAKTYGMQDSVVLLDDLSSGDDVRGTELQGLDREVLVRALKVLEDRGKVKLFRGATPEEEGVKFL